VTIYKFSNLLEQARLPVAAQHKPFQLYKESTIMMIPSDSAEEVDEMDPTYPP